MKTMMNKLEDMLTAAAMAEGGLPEAAQELLELSKTPPFHSVLSPASPMESSPPSFRVPVPQTH
ncbi:MAG: hypothetical protein HW380_233 [Magnetococcales bacterium]|nr:hypothetical protein [Magnetococcales bacterium]